MEVIDGSHLYPSLLDPLSLTLVHFDLLFKLHLKS